MAEMIDTRLKITSWDEKAYREFPDGSKLTRAQVALDGSPDGLAPAWFDALMFYRPDGTADYVTLMHLTGTLGGRSGSFVMRGHGTYDGTTARGESTVVPGSGTGDLVGLTGTAESVSTHDDYPYMPLVLRYVIE
jgi:Protein of unknown function (DUF3224)